MQSHGSKRKKTAKRDVSHSHTHSPGRFIMHHSRAHTGARARVRHAIISRLVRSARSCFAHLFPAALCLSRSDVCARARARARDLPPFRQHAHRRGDECIRAANTGPVETRGTNATLGLSVCAAIISLRLIFPLSPRTLAAALSVAPAVQLFSRVSHSVCEA